MRNRIKYTDESVGPLRVIADFLPPPEELAFKEETQKVTIGLSRRSVAFFKDLAGKHGRPYQAVIRRLLDAYADRYQSPATTGGPGRHARRRA